MRGYQILLVLSSILPGAGCSTASKGTVPAVSSHATPLASSISRADSLRGQSAADSAIAVYNQALAIDPRSPPALYGLALAHIARTRSDRLPIVWYDTALVIAKQLLPLDSTLGLHALGQAYARRGDHALALEALNAAVFRDSSFVPAVIDLGYQYFELGQHFNGAPWLARAARLDSTRTTPLNLLGYSYFHVGMLDTAEALFGRAGKLRPNPTSVGGTMLVRIARGDLDGAIAYTDSVSRANPDSPPYLARLGEALLFAGRWDEAERVLAAAVARAPRSINQYTQRSATLPLAYLAKRSDRRARADSLIAASFAFSDQLLAAGIEPWNVYYHYACLYLIRGDPELAHRWLAAAYDAGMPGPVLMERDPVVTELRADSAFRALVGRLRVREAHYRDRMP